MLKFTKYGRKSGTLAVGMSTSESIAKKGVTSEGYNDVPDGQDRNEPIPPKESTEIIAKESKGKVVTKLPPPPSTATTKKFQIYSNGSSTVSGSNILKQQQPHKDGPIRFSKITREELMKLDSSYRRVAVTHRSMHYTIDRGRVPVLEDGYFPKLQPLNKIFATKTSD